MAGSDNERQTDQNQEQRPDVLADIPWEQFKRQRGIAGVKPVQWLLGLGGLVLLGAVGWWLAQNTGSGEAVVPTSATTVTVTTVVPSSSVSLSTITTTSNTPSSPATPTTLPSHKDLLSEPTDREILVTAEWYVRRYFTDPKSLGLEERGRTHYVEWVSTRSVTHVHQGRVDVDVLVQTLIESDEGYRRQDVRSVVVPLTIDGDGWQVVDLPSKITPVSLNSADPPESTQPLPAELGAVAAQTVGGKVRGGGRVGDRWRVELAVKGLPVVVWVDDNGKLVDPPR
ncbi:MAG: hypothetical protein GEU79_09285 [Acidimicrobiia bacterium]|nr:hypothetical protein [Acidimicrobiia bacterium]